MQVILLVVSLQSILLHTQLMFVFIALTSNVSSPAAERKFDIGDPFKRLKPHKQHTIPCPIDFASRAVDWSVDGKWCVGVGDHGMIVIFSRGGGGGEQK